MDKKAMYNLTYGLFVLTARGRSNKHHQHSDAGDDNPESHDRSREQAELYTSMIQRTKKFNVCLF